MAAAGPQETPLTDNLKNNRLLADMLATISQQIEDVVGDKLKIEERTEYLDIGFGNTRFFPKATPFTTSDITSVKIDSTGAFNGNEQTLTVNDDYRAGPDGRMLILTTGYSFEEDGALQLVYSGGKAHDPVNSTFTLTTGGSLSVTAGDWVIGQTSGARGLAVSYTAATKALVVENYYGAFQVGEQVKTYAAGDTGEGGSGTAKLTDTISAFATKALANVEPIIVKACEMQARYVWKHAVDWENAATDQNNVTMRERPQTRSQIYELQPAVLSLLTTRSKTM